MEQAPVRYRSIIADSQWWDGFRFRDGDIVISTPPKCGTTWTQKICSLLIFQTPDLDRPLDRISPWLDQVLRVRADVFADLEAQEHRRFIKTHTPFDGLPRDERVTYLCVGRDPRDAAMSWDNHMDNLNLVATLQLREKVVGLEDLAELLKDGPPIRLETESDRFWQWVDDPTPVTETVSGLAATLHHLWTFWRRRSDDNVVMLHFGDLKADLEGQMRALAARLRIDVPEEAWPQLARAATFEEMKARADKTGPNTTEPIWNDATRFFNRGTNGQWRGVLDDEAGRRRYAARVEELSGDAEFLRWAHRGPVTA